MSQHQPEHRALIVGVSGPSTSGKTTLARLLRTIFTIPPASPPETDSRSMKLFVFHEDDTYKTDAAIPYMTTSSGDRFQDWDCAAAIDLPLLESTLQHIHDHGALPPELYSKEDQNAVHDSGVSDAEVAAHHARIASWLTKSASDSMPPTSVTSITICILEGFLLYSAPSPNPSIPRRIAELLDVKLFVRSDYARTKSRREARKGYVTLEGFWEDPQGYVDEVVWPNYVADHKWMFQDGDVDTGDLEGIVQEEGILVGPGKGEKSISELLTWCVETMEREIGRIIKEPN